MSPSKRQRREQRTREALDAPRPSRLPRRATVVKILLFLAAIAIWLLICIQVAKAAGVWDEHCTMQGGTLGTPGAIGYILCTFPWLAKGPAGIALFLLLWVPGIAIGWIGLIRDRRLRKWNNQQ